MPNVTDLQFLLKLREALDNLLTFLASSCKSKQALYEDHKENERKDLERTKEF